MSLGNQAERKRLFNQNLKSKREKGDEIWVARILMELSDANRKLGLFEEGIRQAREALEIYQRLGITTDQGECLNNLAWLFYEDKLLEAAKEAAFRSFGLLPEKGHEYQVCRSRRLLGHIYRSEGKREKAISHFEEAIAIVSLFNWHDQLFWSHYSLAEISVDRCGIESAHTHIEQAKSHAVNDAYNLTRTVRLQALVWYQQCRFKHAESEALHASEIYEKLGAAEDLEACRKLLQDIKRAM